jgi:hypothetical protein
LVEMAAMVVQAVVVVVFGVPAIQQFKVARLAATSLVKADLVDTELVVIRREPMESLV